MRQPPEPGTVLPKERLQLAQLAPGQIADRPQAQPLQPLAGVWPDAVESAHRQRTQERIFSARPYHQAAVGLRGVAGELGNRLVAPNANRDDEAGLAKHPPLDALGNRVRPLAAWQTWRQFAV